MQSDSARVKREYDAKYIKMEKNMSEQLESFKSFIKEMNQPKDSSQNEEKLREKLRIVKQQKQDIETMNTTLSKQIETMQLK